MITTLNSKLTYIVFTCFFILASAPHLAQAAKIQIISRSNEIKISESIEVLVMIDAEGESINAFSGTLFFPAEFLELKEIRDGNSIVNFWIERPSTVSNKSGTVLFSGITPGGFDLEQGVLFSALFVGKKRSEVEVSMEDIILLLNDGEGTRTNVTLDKLNITISSTVSEVEKVEDTLDVTAPEEFEIIIAQDELLFDGEYFIVFNTQDKESGINFYMVREGIFGTFRKGESPYRLLTQNPNKKITVRAHDKSGNVTVSVLSPLHDKTLFKSFAFWTILVIVLLALLTIARKWKKRKH